MGQLEVQIIPVTPFQQNCALIWDTESCKGAITDPGGDLPKILANIEKAGVTVEAIFITHGQQDWMFPVQTARQTQQLLSAAGANVTYRELDDLSHC